MFQMKALSQDAVPAALEKALRYRLLNEPEQATSICEDILAIEPGNQEALTMLILSLTDQFGGARPVPPKAALDLVSRLKEQYDRAYYAGIVWEREAIARLRTNAPRAGPAAFECFRQAMALFERAEELSPPTNNDAVLRWNFCARMMTNQADIVPLDEIQEVAASLGE
jgi:hypothetical protein